MTATVRPFTSPRPVDTSARRLLATARVRLRDIPTSWVLLAAGLVFAATIAALLLGSGTWPADRSAAVRSPAAPVARLTPPPVEEQRLLDIPADTARVINAERPIVAGPLPAARAFRFAGEPEARERAVDCLAAASWYEIGDDAVGQRAVMQVVINRARNPAFPHSICRVVFQGSERVTGCQFTFTCDGALLNRRPSAAAWVRARALAHAALNGTVDPSVGHATHYHADYVVPYWASSLDKIAAVGPHVFYRWRGFWGTGPAFSRGTTGEEPVVAALAFLSPIHAADGSAPALFPDGLPIDGAIAGAESATPSLLPPPVAIEGVREKSLRGALVRGAEADANQYFLQLDPYTFPGNYATAAVALCKGKPVCLVMGWRDPSRMGRTVPLTDPQREALSFQFSRKGEGNDRALWNCRQVPRSNPTQCLPDPGPPSPTSRAAVDLTGEPAA